MEKTNKAISSLAGLGGDFTSPRLSDKPNLDSSSFTIKREIEALTVQMGLLSLVATPVSHLIVSPSLSRDVNAKPECKDLIFDSKFKCPECSKSFDMEKALHGHMRTHPDKGYKGCKRPSIAKPKPKPKPRTVPYPSTYPPFTVTWSVTKKRAWKPVRARYSREAVVASSILMDLLKSTWSGDRQEETTSQTPLLELANEACNLSSSTNQTVERPPCSYKVVISGPTEKKERAPRSYRIVIHGLTEQKSGAMLQGAKRKAKCGPHECQICGESFPMGQQLGGHMRKHYNKKPRVQ